MEIIFWIFLLLIVYCYFGYPLFLFLGAKFLKRTVRKEHYEPSVSIVLSVYNEDDVIAQRIENYLSLDYPKEKLEIVIGSDGSTDRTDEIIKSFSNSNIRLVSHNQRRGKMMMINDLVKQAQNEIILFSDARQIFAKDVIKQLVANFADSQVGCVSGELIFSKGETTTGQGINLYWNYEKFIRTQESQLHSMLGATGAIYAIRKELFVLVPKEIILDDMFIPLKIIQKGFRAIFDDSAKAYDKVAESSKEEYRRKTRTLFGNYQIFAFFMNMFNPFTSPIAIQLFSHKLLRVIVPFLMIFTFFLNFFLIKNSFYLIFFCLQITFYLMALVGALARGKNYGILKLILKICYVPYVFCLLNFSALMGFWRFIGAKQQVTWEKARDK